MNGHNGVKCVAILALLSGCAGQPQTPEEFRASYGKLQTFEVKRGYRDVAKTFQARAKECLSNVKVRSQTRTGGVTPMGNTIDMQSFYKATVVVTDKKAELHVQRHYEVSGGTMAGKEPPGGYYTFVADATPLGGTTTRIDFYGSSSSNEILPKAVAGWATGQNLACPDMTRY